MSDPLQRLVTSVRAEIAALLHDARRAPAPGASIPAAKVAQRALKRLGEAAPQRAAWACGAGCSWCCHNAVSVSAPEAFRLARALAALPAERRGPVEARLSERAAAVAGLPLAEQAQRRSPCGLLGDDGRCALYDDRPLACIALVSLDRAACERAFHAPDRPARIPVDTHHYTLGGALNMALRFGSADAGLSPRRYELMDALTTALQAPGGPAALEQRWLAGEDPFAACRPDRTTLSDPTNPDVLALEQATRSEGTPAPRGGAAGAAPGGTADSPR